MPDRPSVVCCLSSVAVTFVHPTQPVEIFGNFYAVWYLGHPLSSTENFTQIAPGEPPPSGNLNARGVAKYSYFSERELDVHVRYMLSPVRPFVCRLSVCLSLCIVSYRIVQGNPSVDRGV